jgi:tetratricopeptide (TPR) repeat protein
MASMHALRSASPFALAAALIAALACSCATPELALKRASKEFDSGSSTKALAILDVGKAGIKDNPAAYALRGKILRSQKRYDEAERELKRATELDPKNGEAWHELALVYYNQKIYPPAAEPWEKYYALLTTKSVDDHCRLSVLEYKAGRFQKSLDAALRGVAMSPTNADSLFDAANAARTLGKVEDSIGYLSTLLKDNPKDYQAVFLRSLAETDAADFAAAGKDADFLAAEDKNADFSALARAYMMFQNDRNLSGAYGALKKRLSDTYRLDSVSGDNFYGLSEDFRAFCKIELARWWTTLPDMSQYAEAMLRGVVDLLPGSPEADLAKSVLAGYQGDQAQAVALAIAAFRGNPSLGYSVSLDAVAKGYAALGDKKRAFNWLLAAVNAEEDFSDAALADSLLADKDIANANDGMPKLGDLARASRWPELLRAAGICASAVPVLGDAYYWRGFAKYEMKDYAGSLADMSKAIECTPTLADAYSIRAELLVSAKKYEEAEADYTAYLRAYNRSDFAYSDRGDLRMNNLKDYLGAFEDYLNLVRLRKGSPELPKAQQKLLEAARLSGQLDFAVSYAGTLLADKATEGLGLVERGKALCATGDFAGARRDLDAAFDSNSRDQDIFIFLALAEAELGKMDEAQMDLDLAELMSPSEVPEYWKAKALVASHSTDKNELNKDFKLLIKLGPEAFAGWFKAHSAAFAAWKDDGAFAYLPW